MIRVLKEKPVTYIKTSETEENPEVLDNPAMWIYTNPTKQEINDLKNLPYPIDKDDGDLRIISSGSNWYIASAFFFFHSQMEDLLNIRSDVDCMIWFKENIMSIYTRRSYDLKFFKPIYNDLLNLGFINKDTVLINSQIYYDEAKKTRESTIDFNEI